MLEEAVDSLMNTIPSMITRRSLAEAAIEKKLAMLYDVKKSNLTILELPDYFWENPQHEKVRLPACMHSMLRRLP